MPTSTRVPLGSIILTLLLVLTAACAPAAPAPTPAPQKEAPKTEASKAPAATAPQPSKSEAPPSASASKKPEVSQIRVGVMPIENLSTVYAADKLGFFKDAGLTVEATALGGGAEILPGVAAGKIQFGYSNVVSVMQARAQGFDFVIVSANYVVPNAPPDPSPMMVKAGSPIKTARDLEGKRLGNNNLNNIGWMMQRSWLKKNGVDPSKVTFREVPYAQMADAIANDQVDAGAMIEPFGTVALEQGKLRVLAHTYVEVLPGIDVGVFAASEKWVKENPVATAAFVSSLGRSVDLFIKNSPERKKYTIEYTKTDAAMVDKMILAPLRAKVDAKGLQDTADLALEHGLLKEKMDVSKLIWETAR